MTKWIHCVFVRYMGENSKKGTFLFSVNYPDYLKSGTTVICQTSHGKIKGTCIGNSFMVSEYALENIVAGIGAYFPLRSVVGIVKEKYTVHKDIEVLEEYL